MAPCANAMPLQPPGGLAKGPPAWDPTGEEFYPACKRKAYLVGQVQEGLTLSLKLLYSCHCQSSLLRLAHHSASQMHQKEWQWESKQGRHREVSRHVPDPGGAPPKLAGRSLLLL